MAHSLGKRKRISRQELEQASQSPSPASDSNDSDAEDLQAIFRRAFEAKFKPLAVEPKKQEIDVTEVAEEEDEDEDSAWSGISDAEDGVQIIDYTDWPTTISAPTKPPTVSKPTGDTDLTEATNLKNDLALQKLLRESHLLSASASTSRTSTPTLSATGIARHKSTDLHLQSLGAKGSVFTQKKMPMAQRKHMTQKARLTEEKRRSEAKEAGIVLERPTLAKAATRRDDNRKREMAVGLPSVGKFRGGTLSLSKKDVRSITGPSGGKGKGKGKSNKGRR
ncbi:hypothetical protein GQ44DRAFT_740057 [Phaeosphaeriaceae sp. PMI808]|nr:hypothetical protein GQ44DRAFT_740057 [Phaeosphaeriaceae sp. PMI808]